MNIIYFNPDQMRADFLGCYGHPLARTPNIDRLAAMATRFDQCHVQHTVCTPSRCSFMTGWYPHVRGHRTLWYPLQPDEPSTLRYLKQAGYDVHWIGKNDLLAQESFAQSVTAVHPHTGGKSGRRDLFAPDHPGHWCFLHSPSPGHTSDWHMVDKAIELLQAHRPGDRPFMLNLALPMPHCPFTCPQPWYDMYDPDELDALDPMRPALLEGKPGFYQLVRRYRQLDKLDVKVLRKIRAVYLGMISYVDAMLGRLLDAMEQTGRMEDTALFFFSDHGEWAGDYGLVEKWASGLDDCLTRVPMIVRVPGGRQGHVVVEPIECFDIMPTTLALADVTCEHTHFARNMLEQLHGAVGDPDRAVFAEGGYDAHEPHCFEGTPQDVGGDRGNAYYVKGLVQQEHPHTCARSVMLRTATHHFVYRPSDVSELYELASDPRLLHNRYQDASMREVRQDLQQRMLNWLIHTGDVVPVHRQMRHFSDTVPRP